MKRNIIILLILAFVTVTVPVLAEPGELPVLKKYSGIIDIVGKCYPGKPHPEEQFEPLLVIRTEQAFADLLSRIPTKDPYPSRDPAYCDSLLQKPDIDFDKQMLVVLVRAAGVGPIVHGVIRSEGRIVIKTEFPEDWSSRLGGIGTYSAVLIKSAKDEVVVESIKPNEKHEVESQAEGDSLEPGPEHHR